MDRFQLRYTKHQLRKKKLLIEIMKIRHSDRMFSDKSISTKDIDTLKTAFSLCPSSCDRKAISLVFIDDKDKKNLLGGLLVGGIGWIHRASHIILIFADKKAYKAKGEIKFMPYLDAGVVIQQLYLSSSTINLASCFCNPNIRNFNRHHFENIFGDDIFCGAFAIGYKYEK